MSIMPSSASIFNALFAERGARVTEGLRYGPHERHRLDVYRPVMGETAGPVVVFIYGGGWRDGERSNYAFVGAALAARGVTTVVPDYRLFPEVMFPDFVEDAALAYRWVARHMAKQRPLVLMGHSAGAHIAALLAVDARYLQAGDETVPAPAGFIGLAGPYSFDPTTFETTREIFASVEEASTARPTQQVTQNAPPAFVAHGLDDETVKLWNARTFAEALERNGVPVRKTEYPGIGHLGILLSLAWPLRWRAPVLDDVMAFIQKAEERTR